MPNPLLRSEDPPIGDTDRATIESALLTLDAEARGLSALSAAVRGSLAQAFIAAIAMIRAARGRIIVSGKDKSRHKS
jgi:arabinose-5-phosphate isomerase